MSVRDVESESATVAIERTAASVFAVIDDIRNVGFHMTQRSSMAMLGSKLKLEVLSPQPSRSTSPNPLSSTSRIVKRSGAPLGLPDY